MQKIGIGVNVFIFNKKGEILLGKRKGVIGNNQWCLPGGKLEFGEKFKIGAIREVDEETGIKISKIDFVNLTNNPLKERGEHYIHINFKTNTNKQPKLMEPDKCSKWEWFSLSNLPNPIFYGHKKLIKAFIMEEIITD